MFKTKFNTILYSVKKDAEGEVTVVFKVPLTDAQNAMSIPNNTNLILTIEDGYLNTNDELTV